LLILQRRVGERIVIDGVTFVEVVSVKGDKVKIGITAPKDVPVFRQELVAERNKDACKDATGA
jgi:carbon storage regulator